MRFPFGRPIIGDEERTAVQAVLDGPILVHGPVSENFEAAFAAFTGAPEAITVSSCTAGMHLIYFALGYGPGDEVIVPAQTHAATAHAVELTGARAIFVDAEPNHGNLDINAIEAAISPRTRAIAVVHYLGVPADMIRVSEIAKRHNLFLLEDCALAPGASVAGVHVGLHGNAGVFSFYPVKHLTTAEGGMIILRDEKLAKRLRNLKAFGVDRSHGERRVPGVYDVVALGFNYRMSEIHCAIGVEQMQRLPKFLDQRRENFELLKRELDGTPGIRVIQQPVNDHVRSCHYCLGILLDTDLVNQRPELMGLLGTRGVGSSVYYPHPVPRLAWYREKYGYNADDFPVATRFSDGIVALPVGPHLSPADMKIIADEVKACLRRLQ